MPRKKVEGVRYLKVRKGATLREIYAASRRQFTAADLQKFTEIEPMIPIEQVLAEVEAAYRDETEKLARRKQRKQGPSKRKRT
jgi:hypothetical protein